MTLVKRIMCTLGALILFQLSSCGGDSNDSLGKVCGGLLGGGCDNDQYCNVSDFSCGAADQTGTCETRPEVCAEVFSPVCGCDDTTYSNPCFAAAAGVSVQAEGSCNPTAGG